MKNKIKLCMQLLLVVTLLGGISEKMVYAGDNENQESLQNVKENELIKGGPSFVTTKGLQKEENKFEANEIEGKIQEYNKAYAENMSLWLEQKDKNLSEVKVIVSEKQQNKIVVTSNHKDEENVFLDKLNGDLTDYKQQIALALEKNDYEDAYEIANKLMQKFPSLKEARQEYLKTYKIYAKEVLNKQVGIIAGGKK